MKLHLPLPLRTALLSALFTYVGLGVTANAKCPIQDDYSINNVGSFCESGHSSDEDNLGESKYECGRGGALHINGTLTLRNVGNVIFRRNNATEIGGAIWAAGVEFRNVEHITFSNNKAYGFMYPCNDGYSTGVRGGGLLRIVKL